MFLRVDEKWTRVTPPPPLRPLPLPTALPPPRQCRFSCHGAEPPDRERVVALELLPQLPAPLLDNPRIFFIQKVWHIPHRRGRVCYGCIHRHRDYSAVGDFLGPRGWSWAAVFAVFFFFFLFSDATTSRPLFYYCVVTHHSSDTMMTLLLTTVMMCRRPSSSSDDGGCPRWRRPWTWCRARRRGGAARAKHPRRRRRKERDVLGVEVPPPAFSAISPPKK